MNIIHVLDENTANKIAAGEVVERPASIVKELVENSIDAQSRNIEVEIQDGGTSFIRVTDDGSGMSPQDAQLAILRHATSKIRAAEDLSHLGSLGFRGEALPSIAAVSKFFLTTRLYTDELATYVEISGGVTADIREAGSHVGTTIIVKDLFFNTPARKKFLKTPATEASHINDILLKLALSYPGIAFKLINNGRLVLSTPGTNQLKDTITSLYGPQTEPDLLPVNYENSVDNITITGYLGKPTLLKSNRQWQTLIVNSRVIGSRSIAKALDNAYHSLLPKSGYPLAVLNIKVDTASIDVNVHPQKSEIKFSDEQKIFRAVYKAVTVVLSAAQNPRELAASPQLPAAAVYHHTPSAASYSRPAARENSAGYSRQETLSYSQPKFADSLPRMPFEEASPEAAQPLSSIRAQLQEKDPFLGAAPLTAAAPGVADESTDTCWQPVLEEEEPEFSLQPLGQIDNCYIISRGPDGLYIIDQHAAHERILYDKMSQDSQRAAAQQLLVPLFMNCDNREIDLIAEYHDTFYSLGFSLDQAGPGTMRITELPNDISLGEAEDAIRQILESLQNLHNPTPQELRHTGLQIASCRAAIKAGEPLNMRQMQALITELCSTRLPFTCPHGRPAMLRFAPGDLAKMFKRT